jgi:cysteinyl-tRNA synthetase
MKKYLTTLILITVLSGCDDATKAIEQAQESANKAIDSLQEQMESVDLSQLNLDQFGDAAESAKELAASIEEALHVDFNDQAALTEVKEHIANAYSCLVDASSESTAEQIIDKIMTSIGNEDAQSLIEKGVDKAKAAKECVM